MTMSAVILGLIDQPTTSLLNRSRTTYRTHADAKADLFDYIEPFYNRKRLHSTLG
jgi:transposase InsO family protein